MKREKNIMKFIVVVVLVLFVGTSSLAATGLNVSIDCQSVKCDQQVTCALKKHSILVVKPVGSCCPRCECGKCPEIDINSVVCTVGFRPVRREKNEDECCDRVECMPDETVGEDLEVEYSISTTSVSKIFSPNQYAQLEDEADFDYEPKSYEIEDEENPCSNINCTLEKYSYFKNIYHCPDDSHTQLLNGIEQHCCRVKHTCVCNECEPESKMIEWCRSNGFNFRPVLAQKGESVPGKCCNSYVCHSSNITCSLNGVYYPHNSEWKINPCTACKCNMGHISCSRIECPQLSCEVRKLISTSDCCPVCTGECRRRSTDSLDILVRSGESWKEADNCVECKCLNGTKRCSTETCDILNCVNPVKKPGQCCPVCEQKPPTLASPKYLKYPPHCKTKLSNFNCSHIVCKYGLQLGPDRCPMCQCALRPVEKCPFACEFKDLAFMALSGRLCKCTRYCERQQLQICKLECPNGLQVDKDGCEMCKCKEIAVSTSGECHIEENGATQIIDNGEMWFDGCRQCLCRDGTQFCSLLTCPTLNCSNPVQDKNTCCPYCPNDTKQFNTSGSKTSQMCQMSKFGLSNQTWLLDEHTECMCKNGLVVCQVNECRPAGCLEPTIDEKQCFKCDNQNYLLSSLSSTYWSCVDEMDRMRPHASSWKQSECVHCRCDNGKIECYDHSESCPLLNCNDRITKKGECCSQCDDLLLKSSVYGFHRNSFTIKLLSSICIMVIVLILIFLVVIYKYRTKSEKAMVVASRRGSIGRQTNKSIKVVETIDSEKRNEVGVPLIGRFNFNHEHNFLLANRLDTHAAVASNSSSEWINTTGMMSKSTTQTESSVSSQVTSTKSIKPKSSIDGSYIYHC